MGVVFFTFTWLGTFPSYIEGNKINLSISSEVFVYGWMHAVEQVHEQGAERSLLSQLG
jgi:hypothetical protein